MTLGFCPYGEKCCFAHGWVNLDACRCAKITHGVDGSITSPWELPFGDQLRLTSCAVSCCVMYARENDDMIRVTSALTLRIHQIKRPWEYCPVPAVQGEPTSVALPPPTGSTSCGKARGATSSRRSSSTHKLCSHNSRANNPKLQTGCHRPLCPSRRRLPVGYDVLHVGALHALVDTGRLSARAGSDSSQRR